MINSIRYSILILFFLLVFNGQGFAQSRPGADEENDIITAVSEINSGHYSEARTLLSSVLEKNTENDAAWYYLAMTAILENDLAEAEETLNQTLTKSKENIASVVEALNRQAKDQKLSAEQQKEYEALLIKVNNAYSDTGEVTAKTGEEIAEANLAIKKMAEMLEAAKKEAEDAAKSLPKVAENVDELNKKAKEGRDNLNKMVEGFDLQESISKIVDVTGAVANLYAATRTLIDLPSIWNNDDITTGEKLLFLDLLYQCL